MTEKKNTRLEEEKKVIKRAFEGNEHALKLVQALLLGVELTDDEKSKVKEVMSADVIKILEHRLLPKLSKDTQIGQQSDEWAGVEEMVFGHPESTVQQAVHYKKLAIDYTKQAIELLKDPFGKQLDLTYNPEQYPEDRLGIMLLGRNMYIKHIQSTLSVIWVIAEMDKGENPQDVAKRLLQDSSM